MADPRPIEVEANVEDKDIGFVREGLEVEVKFDAFPFTRYGLLKGRVRKLGRDAAPVPSAPQTAISNTSNGAQGATPNGATDSGYRAAVSLDLDFMLVNDRHERMQPGMRVAVEIITGDRRVIGYLLSPVVQGGVSEAGRKR